jgi:hypothetical protein
MIKHIKKRVSLSLLKKRARAAEKKVDTLRTEIRALNKSILSLKRIQKGVSVGFRPIAKKP